MKTIKSDLGRIAFVFLWLGFIGAISFMEAWLKFQAPGVDLATGLSIGKLVFSALNKVEWVLAIAIFTSLFLSRAQVLKGSNRIYVVILIFLLIQTFWLLPELGKRADLHIQHLPVQPSYLHVYYVGLELLKAIGLLVIGLKGIKKMASNPHLSGNDHG